MERVKRNATKYLKKIELRKIAGSTLTETWFDNSIELNPGLVAVIGNQGSGKSALTDAIALCGDSSAQDFSFLTVKRFFCDGHKRASHFTAGLHWEGGPPSEVRLDARVHPASVERVRYVPQGFFEIVTNETEVGEGGRFYDEITKAVFSHVAELNGWAPARSPDWFINEHRR